MRKIASTPWKYLATPHNKISFNVRCHRKRKSKKMKNTFRISFLTRLPVFCLTLNTPNCCSIVDISHGSFAFFNFSSFPLSPAIPPLQWHLANDLHRLLFARDFFSHIIGQIIDAIKNDWDGIEAMKRGFLPFFLLCCCNFEVKSLFLLVRICWSHFDFVRLLLRR